MTIDILKYYVIRNSQTIIETWLRISNVRIRILKRIWKTNLTESQRYLKLSLQQLILSKFLESFDQINFKKLSNCFVISLEESDREAPLLLPLWTNHLIGKIDSFWSVGFLSFGSINSWMLNQNSSTLNFLARSSEYRIFSIPRTMSPTKNSNSNDFTCMHLNEPLSGFSSRIWKKKTYAL